MCGEGGVDTLQRGEVEVVGRYIELAVKGGGCESRHEGENGDEGDEGDGRQHRETLTTLDKM